MTDQMLIADAHEEIVALKELLKLYKKLDVENTSLAIEVSKMKQQLDETIQISPELRNRITECLRNAKDNSLELMFSEDALISFNGERRADIYRGEIADINSILAELGVE